MNSTLRPFVYTIQKYCELLCGSVKWIALGIGFFSLVWWWVYWYSHPTLPLSPAPPQSTIAHACGACLLGNAVENSVAPLDLKVLGVTVSENPNLSLALLSIDGQPPYVVKIGEQIKVGAVLSKVQSDKIVVEIQGQSQDYIVPQLPTSSGRGAP